MATYKVVLNNEFEAEAIVKAMYESGNVILFEYADRLKERIDRKVKAQERQDSVRKMIADYEAGLSAGTRAEAAKHSIAEPAVKSSTSVREIPPELLAAVEPRTPVEPPDVVE